MAVWQVLSLLPEGKRWDFLVSLVTEGSPRLNSTSFPSGACTPDAALGFAGSVLRRLAVVLAGSLV